MMRHNYVVTSLHSAVARHSFADSAMGCSIQWVLLLAISFALSGCQRPTQKLPAPPQFGWAVQPSPAPSNPPIEVVQPYGQSALSDDNARFSGVDTVFFAADSADLDPEARSVLDVQAQWLTERPSVSARIEGHTDQRQSREFSFAIGERRADAIRLYLVARGVAKSRIAVASLGKEQPVSATPDQDGWARNRRGQTIMVYAAQRK